MNPREEEISIVIEGIPEWGTEEDAAYLEQLINEFPSQKEILEQQARALRKHLRGEDPDPAPPVEDEGAEPPPPREPEPPPPDDDG